MNLRTAPAALTALTDRTARSTTRAALLRATAVAAAAGALLTAGAAGSAQAATRPAGEPGAAGRPDQAVGLVKNDRVTPWSVVDYALEVTGGRAEG
ncbi:hypothetical protein ACIRD2_29285 [Streptomyces sp. NPDC093595]|uniref:hypothetical protein n=1 Tax=Streptomyces sp. NPDC093595 TaxID=3366045 RepID=UPI0038215DD6